MVLVAARHRRYVSFERCSVQYQRTTHGSCPRSARLWGLERRGLHWGSHSSQGPQAISHAISDLGDASGAMPIGCEKGKRASPEKILRGACATTSHTPSDIDLTLDARCGQADIAQDARENRATSAWQAAPPLAAAPRASPPPVPHSSLHHVNAMHCTSHATHTHTTTVSPHQHKSSQLGRLTSAASSMLPMGRRLPRYLSCRSRPTCGGPCTKGHKR
jgi:hypothetical protein